jgi:hypothetical protein
MVDESIMTRVMKLLALANDEGASSHERQLAEEHADRLMSQHMIDRWEATQRAKRGNAQARKPIQVEWNIQMQNLDAEGADNHLEFYYQVVNMMEYIIHHCGARVNRNFKFVDGGRQYKIVGFPEDIMYAERIWFNVFKTFVNNVNPQWDTAKSIKYNAYNFASAGVSWKNMVLIAEGAKDTRLEWPWRYQDEDESRPHYVRYGFQAGGPVDPGNKPWGQSIHKLKRACKKYCDENGLDYPYARSSRLRVATRNSFARSYRATITQRLQEIRDAAKSDIYQTDKYALALRDTKERVNEEFYRLFPEFDPVVQAKRRAAEDAEIRRQWDALTPAQQNKLRREQEAREARYDREAKRARRNYDMLREDRIDAAAWERGTAAAESVNLRADEEVDKDKDRQAIQ